MTIPYPSVGQLSHHVVPALGPCPATLLGANLSLPVDGKAWSLEGQRGQQSSVLTISPLISPLSWVEEDRGGHIPVHRGVMNLSQGHACQSEAGPSAGSREGRAQRCLCPGLPLPCCLSAVHFTLKFHLLKLSLPHHPLISV